MLPKRRANRLEGFDYTQDGMYFITVCTKDRKWLLSVVGADDLGGPQIRLTDFGRVVEDNLIKMQGIYSDIRIEKYVIMPNHVHLLICIQRKAESDSGAPRSSPPTNLSNYIAALKKFTNRKSGEKLWQRSFHDHIIRSDADYVLHLQYIDENPAKWLLGKDEYYA